jgi:hypothetical protein
MGISAALPTFLHVTLFISSLGRKIKITLFPNKATEPTSKDDALKD